ncbi:glycoside hydrolase family 65 protein [Paenibacillus sp. NFR01]|uniref:glycoside hydrolase family 65 protein n=1 Tax=Paenibacillus sp. NFR01 TaxID=1566279 RepID=UPI0008B75741|nr:glycosyl hydrolase family 65 protein [Paenibacillus sp. NFR01]SEU29601.1 alpha,alpha-trehalose phosphorylase [Paenibacillus sp. NFR01]
MKMKPYVHPKPLYPYREWSLEEEHYTDEDNQRSESVFAIGNGYIGMRGNFEEGYHGKLGKSVNGNYLNGFYDAEPIHYPEGAYGYPDWNQSMLNVTDARKISLSVMGHAFHLNTGTLHQYKRSLDMQGGFLRREIDWESPGGQRLRLRITRLTAFGNKHLAAIRYEVTALGFAGEVVIASAMDGRIARPPATNDPRLGSGSELPHLLAEDMAHEDGFAWMRQRTRNTRFALLTGMSHQLVSPARGEQEYAAEGEALTCRFRIHLNDGETAVLTKYISYHTSRDYPEEELLPRTETLLREAAEAGFEALLAEQRAYLDDFWARADVEITGDPSLQQGIRFNAFQLLQSVGRDGMTNIGAKGLTGDGYEGHYFWDTELYMLPFFTFTRPDIARSLLEFRYRTLGPARERAATLSQRGALYPWRTIDGPENSAYFPAGTAQAHINADIAYAIRQYVLATGDTGFLVAQGAEILFETSRFWADLGFFNPERDGAFCIHGVTGPDEYTAIVNNNAYTNLMVRCQLEYAAETADLLRESYPADYANLARRIGLKDEEIELWRKAAARMFIPVDEQRGIIAQDDAFLLKKRWDFDNVPADKYPLLLHFHPLVIYRHQVLKQADVVLALFLLGEWFTPEEKRRNYQYYEPLTTHDSSLSPCIHSIMSAELGDLESAYGYFDRTVRMDLDDINRNAKDGLHTAAMAGSWMSIVNGFGGLRLHSGKLSFQPRLPERWDSCRFRIAFRGGLLEVGIFRNKVRYSLLEGDSLELLHAGKPLTLAAGETTVLAL